MAIFSKINDLAGLIQHRLNDGQEIRPFPAAVTQLLSAFENPNSNSEVFARIIECDPALAMRLLRMANSPLFGLTRTIGSVGHAASVLGMRSLKTLAMSVAGATMFAQGKSASNEREELWTHSLGTGAVARALAEHDPKVSPDDAFLASVFHDVGKLFLYDVVPDEYSEMNRQYVGEELISQEKCAFGSTHEEIGMQSASTWNLTEDLKVVIGYHHRPSEAIAHQELVSMVHVANELARAWGIGSTSESETDMSDYVFERLRIDEETLASVREKAFTAFVDSQATV